jgi:hypothetical protein
MLPGIRTLIGKLDGRRPRRRKRHAMPAFCETLERRAMLNVAPVFTAAPYEFIVDDTTGAGSDLGEVEVTDADGDFLYYWIESGDENEYFSFNNGTITQNVFLDGSVTEFELEVGVQDYLHQVTATVTISVNLGLIDAVEDYIDIAADASIGTLIGTVVATSSGGQTLQFSIDDFGQDVPFQIDSDGKITTTGSLSGGAGDCYFQIIVTDGTQTDSIFIIITVLDD